MRPLSKYVNLKADADPRIGKLVSNLFTKVVLVSTYQLAMQVAKDYELTCITQEL